MRNNAGVPLPTEEGKGQQQGGHKQRAEQTAKKKDT